MVAIDLAVAIRLFGKHQM